MYPHHSQLYKKAKMSSPINDISVANPNYLRDANSTNVVKPGGCSS